MRSKICLWVVLLSLLPILSYAQQQSNSPVQEIYVKSGMEKQFGELPSLIEEIFEQSVQENDQAGKLPKNVLAIIKASIPEAFVPEQMKKTTISEFTDKLTTQDMKDVITWLDSPIGKICTRLEELSSTVEAQAEVQKYAATLQNALPSGERMKLLSELDSAVKGTETGVDVAIHSQAAIALAFISTFPKEQQKPIDEVLREMEKMRPSLETSVRSQMMLQFLYTYRSLTDTEIKQYVEFAKSPAGAKYCSASMQAYKSVLIEGAVKWGRLIGDGIKKLPGSSGA